MALSLSRRSLVKAAPAALAGAGLLAAASRSATADAVPGVYVTVDELAYVTVSHWGFDQEFHTGEILVNASWAEEVVEVFRQLHAERFPIEQMRVITKEEIDAPPTGVEYKETHTRNLRTHIQALWKTDEVRPSRPDVRHEIRMGMYYFTEALFDAIPVVYHRLGGAIRRAYHDHPDYHGIDVPAMIRFGSWIGGDRDGNPNVTATTTREAILTQQASWLMSNGDYTAIIEGHADEQGTREYNLALGARRASAVQSYLIERGVYLAPSGWEVGFVSAAHTDEDIDTTVAAVAETFKNWSK